MNELVGLIPAAGRGSRLAPLPSSKELFPIGFTWRHTAEGRKLSPKVVSEYLVEALVRGGARRICMIINAGKADIMRFYGDGSAHGAHIAYLVQEDPTHTPAGMPHALNLARPWIGGDTVLFGMPDTILQPSDAFAILLEAHNRQKADVTLGLFATDEPWRFGMVEFAEDGRLLRCLDKPRQCDLHYMWGIACWGPAFTDYLASFVANNKGSAEMLLGDAFLGAARAGLRVHCHPFEDGSYLDVGTPDDLLQAAIRFCRHPEEL
ncbi:MAG: sugar phosphate nucleotidyltransferase [Anaerolineae bacterium]